ncbi:hypothetical protein CWI38_1428p0010 [Hamiltosporidium tvaerminnensis]|uniref:Uncharacterized protein n=1 Tax=Hamiltosporidium tvaerminnensis TaxID=1176355 RepID=A0A4Q9LRY7_9MICR|nr:hypothetical protein CWI38_1428p0010 [Hamiltosporidium tvaerminnensis]
MFLKLFLILVLGYHKSIIQATSDREELLSKDEIENDNVAIEEYLWNQLTDFSRNCLKKVIEKRHIKSKNFLLSMQTSFDKFNGQKRFFDASLENNFCLFCISKSNSFFVAFNDYLNEYDQISLYHAVNLAPKNVENFECLNLHIFLTKKVDFFNYFGQGFDIKSLELFFSKFSIFYFDKMKLKIEYQIEIFTKQIPDENICLLERDLLKVSEINNHENINKKTFNVHLFFNLGFSFSTEIFDTKNEKNVYKKIKFNIYIGLNNTIEYAFTLNLNKNDEMIEFIQNSYSFKELTDIKTKLNEIAREYEKQD